MGKKITTGAAFTIYALKSRALVRCTHNIHFVICEIKYIYFIIPVFKVQGKLYCKKKSITEILILTQVPFKYFSNTEIRTKNK